MCLRACLSDSSYNCSYKSFISRDMVLKLLLVLLVTSVVCTNGTSYNCEKVASIAALEDHNTIVETNQRMLTGTWISQGCEVRPGPEYILRSYTFNRDSSFNLYQHYYWDDSCSSPKWTVTAHGRIQLRNAVVQAGACSTNLKYTNITVTPQNIDAAETLDILLETECPDRKWKPWSSNEEQLVYENKYAEGRRIAYNLWRDSYIGTRSKQHSAKNKNQSSAAEIACLGPLRWAFNEIKLLKIQMRPVVDNTINRATYRKLELLLGDIHSDFRHRAVYSPSSFQAVLVKQTKGEMISIDGHYYTIGHPVPSSMFINGKTPPHLIEKPHLPPYIWGEWVSSRCEVRPLGIYLTRGFSFFEDDYSWVGDHKFFADPFCAIPKFRVTAAGSFQLKGASNKVQGASNLDIYIEKASLTVLDHRVIYDLQLPGICGSDVWRVNVTQELSASNGCIPLGFFLPSTQYDIVKIEMNYKGSWLLFLGQVDTDNLPSSAGKSRPTAFQAPLVKCREVSFFPQDLSSIFGDDFSSAPSYGQIYTFRILLLLTVSYLLR